METTLTLKFKGVEAKLLDTMVKSGLFNSKSEAIRAALVNYSMQSGFLDKKEIWKEIEKHTKRKVSDSKLEENIAKIKNEI
jgi:Arc/MetJ-type ribon-helix-helix transcriptional regulator